MNEKEYRVRKLYGRGLQKDSFQVRVPGSKSITNRALLLAMLSDGECLLKGALFSDDSRYLQECIRALGFEIQGQEDSGLVRIRGLGGEMPGTEGTVYVGSAGTAARFLTALLGLKKGIWHLDASEQMRRRPMKPLLDCLQEMGVQVRFEGEEGHFPFTLVTDSEEEDGKFRRKQKLAGGKADGEPDSEPDNSGPDGGADRQDGEEGTEELTVDIGHSSQFLSALLIAACCSRKNFRIHVKGTHGMSYIHMTLAMMEQFGIKTVRIEDGFETRGGQCYRHRTYEIEPDASAACYFYGMAALLGIEGMVEGVFFDSLQGDVEFLRILERMGCTLQETEQGIRLKGPENGRLKGITANMHACSDQAITLAAIAPFADSPVTITGIGHIRYQESNRIKAVVTELSRIGIRCEEGEDTIIIWPGTPVPGRIRTYEDHRMAMGFSLTGLRAEGIVIDDPACCRKTFEQYFQVLDGVIEELEGKGRTESYSFPSQQ